MTEQQYRVIADRDNGDDVDHYEWSARRGDRVVWEVVNDNSEAEIVRVERPVPTTDEPSGLGFRIERRGTVDVFVFDNGSCHPATDAEVTLWNRLHHSPNAPTREQIAEAILPVMASDWDRTKAPSPYRIADAVIEKLRQLACDGSGHCSSPLHVHGCYSDDGSACEVPAEHLALIQNGAAR